MSIIRVHVNHQGSCQPSGFMSIIRIPVNHWSWKQRHDYLLRTVSRVYLTVLTQALHRWTVVASAFRASWHCPEWSPVCVYWRLGCARDSAARGCQHPHCKRRAAQATAWRCGSRSLTRCVSNRCHMPGACDVTDMYECQLPPSKLFTFVVAGCCDQLHVEALVPISLTRMVALPYPFGASLEIRAFCIK